LDAACAGSRQARAFFSFVERRGLSGETTGQGKLPYWRFWPWRVYRLPVREHSSTQPGAAR